MSYLKKILIAIVITIVAILGYSTISKAAYEVGDKVKLNYQDYKKRSDLFCIEHDERLWSNTDVTYEVVSIIRIVGNTSTDHKGKKIESKYNGQMAYILSSNASKDTKQKALWYILQTWMRQVGKNHAGLFEGISNSNNEGSTSINKGAIDYAEKIENLGIKDNTNKSNIKVATQGDYLRIGPFNWTFSGSLSKVEVKDQDKKVISGVRFGQYSGSTLKEISVEKIPSGKNFYILIPSNGGTTKITDITATGSTNVKSVTMYFLRARSGNVYQNLMSARPGTSDYKYDDTFTYDIDLLGHLKVIKVDKNNNVLKLSNVGFVLQNKDTGKYVHQDSDGTITYVDNRDQATTFYTDTNGEFTVENLIVGTYVAYETTNPHYGYEIISDGVEQTIVVDKTTELKIENEQKYIKLSGYVWLDKQFAKASTRNDLYKDNTNDSEDILLEDVIVRLIDRTTGETVKSTTTKEIQSSDGIIRYYQFTDVLVSDLSNYYVEFEYDGLTYTNVVPHIDLDNGSKAAENASVRDEFNKQFSTIEGASDTTGVALDQSGNVAHELSYTRNPDEHTSTLVNDGLPIGQYPITANTDETGYSIADQFEPGKEEIPYINLGLYEREQPDLALVKDMQNVRLSINGYQHVYEYAQRFNNQGDYPGTGFNVGVKFGSEYMSQSYTRAIYKADYEYVNENDKSRELKVYITYRIAIRNESTNLVTQANSVVDYFDSRYTMVAAGTGVNQEGTITGNLNYQQEGYNDEYSKAIIETNTRLNAQTQSDIYVQFELSREAVINILNDGENLDNTVEINSYSSFDTNGNVYAGVDLDSNPGNAVPGDKTTYEDDTDGSPALKLEVANARELTGKVFLDSTSGELMTGQVRQGSGAYEEGETGISGVAVTLTENTGTGKVYTATTDENGDFYISDFIPGDYTLTYTWGDETYTVQNYKGTVYSKDRYDANIANKEWYKTDVDTRWTDAVDDYQTRLDIDAELNEITGSTETTISKMNSTTPTMGIGVENYDSTTTDATGDELKFVIRNVDFGIVERARQDMGLDKRVKTMKVTLANGQVLANLEITEDGTLEGQTSSVTYIPPSPNSVPSNGLVRLEMDSELIEGARVEIGYEIKASNNSELDYISEDFYKYGIVSGDPITITPSGIVDYLDSDWDFDASSNTAWEAVDKDDSRLNLAEVVYNDPNSTIDDKKILYTEALKESNLSPTESATVMLNVSKLLTSSQDIELDNETEVVKVEKPGGSTITSTPGNYVPGTGPQVESDDDMAETVIITPNTGSNQNYILPVAVVITAFVILGAGVVFIKKKVLNK